MQKTITAVRSTNFLSRLLSGVKSSANDVKQDKLTTKVTAGTTTVGEAEEEAVSPKKPGWKRVTIAEEEEPQGMFFSHMDLSQKMLGVFARIHFRRFPYSSW